MRRAIFGFWSYLEFFVVLVLFLPIFAILRLFHRNDPMLRVPGQAMRVFGRMTGALTPLWRFSTDGKPPSNIKDQAYVVISNHESTADIFLLAKLRWDMRWIAKEELFRTPFVGWALRMSGDIRLRRGDKESIRAMVAECNRSLQSGMSVMLFPEGTRSKDGRILPFKDGAFRMAIENQVPILPVAIAGTNTCMPKHSLWFGDARAHARVLDPISTEGLTIDDLPRVRDMARARIQAASDNLRKELGLINEEAFPIGAHLGTPPNR